MPAAHPLYAAIAAASDGNQIGLTSFWATVHAFLVAQIDSPEERQGIEQAALAAFDAFVAPRIGTVLASILRPQVAPTLEAILVKLATS